MPGRQRAPLELSDEERDALERLAARTRSARHVRFRARIVLRAAAGETDVSIAAALRCSRTTVHLWRTRFGERRLDGLYAEPRPGGPPKCGDDQVRQVLSVTP